MSTFGNNHNPTRSSPSQVLLYFKSPSVRLIQVIWLMPLPCTTCQFSADHLCTITHCSLWVARGQDLQKILARAGQTHCPGATKDQLYLHDSTINYIPDAHGSAGNSAEPQEVASLQNIDCCHFSEGLQHFPRVFCFSKCLKCVTRGKTLVLVLLLLDAWWLFLCKAEIWPTFSFFLNPSEFSWIKSICRPPYTKARTNFYSNEHRRNKCKLVLEWLSLREINMPDETSKLKMRAPVLNCNNSPTSSGHSSHSLLKYFLEVSIITVKNSNSKAECKEEKKPSDLERNSCQLHSWLFFHLAPLSLTGEWTTSTMTLHVPLGPSISLGQCSSFQSCCILQVLESQGSCFLGLIDSTGASKTVAN